MRITAVVHNYPPAHNAGAEWMLHPMLAALAARGHKVEVHLSRHIPGGNRKPWRLDDVLVYPLGAHGRTDVPPDIYITHLDCIRPVAARSRGFGKPVVVVQHNTLDFDLKSITEARPDLIVHNSEWMRDWMRAEGHVYPGIVCHPPVLEEHYRTEPGEKVTLINLTTGKGADLLWQLAERMPDTPFLAVQGNYGGQIVKDLPNVEVCGPFDGRKMRDEVYAKTRILLVPSRYESWGRVATEAMCSGIPVIAHRAIGALEENLGEAGIWCDRDQPSQWVAEIKRLSKPTEYETASQAARARFETFDFQAELDNWVGALEDLARVPRTPPPYFVGLRSVRQAQPEPVPEVRELPSPLPATPVPAPKPRAPRKTKTQAELSTERDNRGR